MAVTPVGHESSTSAGNSKIGPFNSVVFRIAAIAVVLIALFLLAFKLLPADLHGPVRSQPLGHDSSTAPSTSSPAVPPSASK